MESNRNSKHVIIIEPEPYYRVSTAYFLSRMGYVVTGCSSCVEATLLLGKWGEMEHRLALVIVPLSQESLALVEAIRGRQAQLPVLFVTPGPDGTSIRTCRAHELTSVLLKPYSFDQVLRAMLELQQAAPVSGGAETILGERSTGRGWRCRERRRS